MTDHKEFSTIKDRAKRKLERDMGPLLMEALNNPKTEEIMVNEDGKVWLELQGERAQCIGTIRRPQAQAILETVAGYLGKEVTRDTPLLEGEFPLDGSRFAGQLGPVVANGAPIFAIRKKATAVFTLEQYVESGIMSEAQRQALIQAVIDHKNILVVGSTSSGKTTLVNAIIRQMVDHDSLERFIIIEDTGEIQCTAPNYVQYHTSIDVSMTMLLKTTLRMRPDRILVGEVRGEEALDLLDAWNTGHPGGAATLHANNAQEGLTRLKSLVSRNGSAPAEIEPLIGEAVQVLVFITKTPDGKRRVQEIIEVSGYADGQYITKTL